MKYQTIINIFVTIFVIIISFFIIRFIFSGSEDTWICKDGQWIKHGNPQKPAPQIWCK